MATLTELVAAVVVQSSAAAFSHFGVTFELPQIEQRNPAVERVVARSPRQAAKPARVEPVKVEKAAICPEKARMIRA